MNALHLNIKPLVLALLAAGALSACGGGGGGGSTAVDSGQSGTPNTGTDTGTNTGGNPPGGTDNGGSSTTIPAPVATNESMVMACVDGANFQCSGDKLIRTDNSVGLTSSGVQVFGRSTNDLVTPNPSPGTATGFELSPANLPGIAEIRLRKGENGAVSRVALILDKFGLQWKEGEERPKIVETFPSTQGRIVLSSNGELPAAPSALLSSLFDYNAAARTGTKANYANNSYFPRSTPSRCDGSTCPPSSEQGTITDNSTGTNASDWRKGGDIIDSMNAKRFHEDGDIHAPDVPFPGSKGYRELANWAYDHVNLSNWLSQDTVLHEDWNDFKGNEHNKNRRGFVAFGNVTPPANVPTSGTVTYSGIYHGSYAKNRTDDPTSFRGTVGITVDFATRKVTLEFTDPKTDDAAATEVPVKFDSTAWTGAANTNVANYLTGPVNNNGLTGGLSGRYFGPVVSTGTGGTGPAEIGGTFRLSNAATGAAFIGGFIGRKK